uniref:Retrovirus-related Pol polyprotein from transposon TNT 1-94 n=1 Tax=Tanacetum cinerariifolium TaxID=118510 RepID=A0A699GYI9_TANCI|nr:retrovirus-related Pol polyprotein from transposon TNT 1-94 [Tanacetum cinerariifolium]
MSIQEIEDLKQQYLDEMKHLINLEYRDEIKIDELKGNFNSMSNEINKKEKLQQLEQVPNLSTYPSKCFNSFCYDDDDEDYTAVITPDFLITDSLIMENEHLNTILEMESDEFIKSSVENLVHIPSESEDFSDIKSECDIPDYDDSQTTNFSTFSNPLFDDSTSSDDESSHEEVIHEMSFKTFSNPLFDLNEEIISSEFNPTHNEDLDSNPKNDRFDTESYLLESLLNRDTLMASSPKFDSLLEEFSGELAHTDLIPPGINEANCDPEEDIHLVERLLYYSDSEGDNLSLERLLHDDYIPLPDILDFSNVIQVFLPFLTYLVISSILLSSRSEDTIFDPGISSYHFSSLEPGASHLSETFMKFIVYPNHLNESPIKILIPGMGRLLPKDFVLKSSFPQLQSGNHVLKNKDDVSFIKPYEYLEPVVFETEVSSDQNGQTDQNDHNDQSVQNDEVLNDDHSDHSNHTNDEQIIDNIQNTKDIQISKHLSSPSVKDTLVKNTIPTPTPPLPVSSIVSPAPQDRWSQDKHIELVNIIGNPRARMLTRAMAKQLSAASAHECLFVDFLFEEEPKKQEGIDYDETFAQVTRPEAIIIFLAFATYMNFIVYQMDVKSAFLNGKLKEEVYVKQPPGFENNEFPNHVCKLDKALYGLKQALKAWYLKGTPSLGLRYLKCSGFDLKGYSESDYAGCNMDKKSTLATAGCCANILWMKGQLTNYDIIYEKLVDIFTKPLDEPTFKRLIVKLGSNLSVLVDKTKSARDVLKTDHTDSGANKESRADDISFKVKLEDLLDILKDTRSAFFTLNSLPYEPIIVLNECEEEEEVAKDKDTEATSHNEELEQAKAKAKAKVACLPTELKELLSKSTGLSGEIKELKKHARDIKIELHGDLKDIPTKQETFTSTISSISSQFKILDSLPSILYKVTDTVNRFATMVKNASGATSMNVTSAGKATASPAEGEKNTKDADTNLKDELVDLLGKNVLTQYYTKKLLFDKYCDKMLKRRKALRSQYVKFTQRKALSY